MPTPAACARVGGRHSLVSRGLAFSRGIAYRLHGVFWQARLALVGQLECPLSGSQELVGPGENMTDQPFFIPSLLISLVAIPLVLGVIPRNRWYGIRTAQTLSDERVWY